MATPSYAPGQQVQVYDTGRKRWYKAEIAYYEGRTDGDNLSVWFCHLRNGNRGTFDELHIRPLKSKEE